MDSSVAIASSNEALMARLLDGDGDASQFGVGLASSPIDAVAAVGGTTAAKPASWGNGTRWPAVVSADRLPPLASRLGLRALPARLRYAAATNARALVLFLILGGRLSWKSPTSPQRALDDPCGSPCRL